MKMNKWPLALVAATCLITIVSCDPDEPQAPTQAELLASSTWKFQSATYGGVDVSTAPQLACFIDNTLTFTTSNNYTVTEGTTVCSPSTAGSGTWSFKPVDSLQLSTSLVTGGSGTFKINSLTATNLVLAQNVTLAPLPTQLLVVTFKH
jgi:hypothetical protein